MSDEAYPLLAKSLKEEKVCFVIKVAVETSHSPKETASDLIELALRGLFEKLQLRIKGITVIKQ